MTTITVFKPLAPEVRRDEVVRSPLPDLRGATLGVIENTKPNARRLLTGAAEELKDRFGAGQVVVERKNSAAEGMSDDAFERLRKQQAMLVLAGSGD